MNCPPRIARVLLEIIRLGILRARAASWTGDAKRCEAETDHIHNLPGLLLDFRLDGIRYYLDAERKGYRQTVAGKEPGDLTRLWKNLDEAVASELLTPAQ